MMDIDIEDCEIETVSINKKRDLLPILNDNTEYPLFFTKFLKSNTPCIFENISLSWMCHKTWIRDSEINFEYLRSKYGELTAPVADCNSLSYNAHSKNDMKVKDYLNYLETNRNEILYLKDWHLKRLRPNENFYEVPKYFASDWLNEYALDHEGDDFMFVYIGPAGSWTPFHSDVYSSYSWSVNVIGLKKWIILPPGEEDKLRDSFGNLPLQFKPEEHNNVFFYEVQQAQGEAIFVPSGWYHQVTNVKDTISINHNWINGCNVNIVWNALENQLKIIEQEIEELKLSPEFTTDCQKMLKALFGMDHTSFIILILHIANKRILQLQGHKYVQFKQFTFGKKHTMFDLKCIQNIFKNITNKIIYYKKILSSDLIEKIYVIQSQIIKLLDIYMLAFLCT